MTHDPIGPATLAAARALLAERDAEIARLRNAIEELTAASRAVIDRWAAYDETLPFEFEVALGDLDVCVCDQDRAERWPDSPYFAWVSPPGEGGATMLDKLERLERAATPGPWEEHESVDEGFWLESAAGGVVSNDTGPHIWPLEADCNLMVAARNALPALLRVARAAERFAGLDGLPCDYEDGVPDECPGVAKTGGPCHWCELRAALAALEGGEG